MKKSYSTIKKTLHNVSHVIFDLDGLILDTERYYFEAASSVAKQSEKEYSPQINQQVMGMLGVDAARRAVQLLDLPISPEEYRRIHTERYRRHLHEAVLLPDTERTYKRAIENLVGKHDGKRLTHELRMKILGRPETDTCKIIVADLKLPIAWQQFCGEFRAETLKQFHSCTSFMPGAQKLVTHLHNHQIPIAIATSSCDESFEVKTKHHEEFFKLFNHAVRGGSDPEVKKGKPAPDIFQVCASRFKVKPAKPENVLVFEDAPNGVTGALAAGMQVVMVPDEHTEPELCQNATVVVKSLEDFKPEWFGLPSYDDENNNSNQSN